VPGAVVSIPHAFLLHRHPELHCELTQPAPSVRGPRAPSPSPDLLLQELPLGQSLADEGSRLRGEAEDQNW
jgi:hypothetical protein